MNDELDNELYDDMEHDYVVGFDMSDGADDSVITVKTLKKREGESEADQYIWKPDALKVWEKAMLAAETDSAAAKAAVSAETEAPKKYWGKVLSDLSDVELDNVVWAASLYSVEEREEILAEIKMRAFTRGVELQKAAVV